jgi:hypothetical protein
MVTVRWFVSPAHAQTPGSNARRCHAFDPRRHRVVDRVGKVDAGVASAGAGRTENLICTHAKVAISQQYCAALGSAGAWFRRAQQNSLPALHFGELYYRIIRCGGQVSALAEYALHLHPQRAKAAHREFPTGPLNSAQPAGTAGHHRPARHTRSSARRRCKARLR